MNTRVVELSWHPHSVASYQTVNVIHWLLRSSSAFLLDDLISSSNTALPTAKAWKGEDLQTATLELIHFLAERDTAFPSCIVIAFFSIHLSPGTTFIDNAKSYRTAAVNDKS